MIKARFVTSSGRIVSEGVGYDWYKAFDRAYTELMKIPLECRGDCKIRFE